jgi:RHS repeat-associated protein
MLPTPSNTAQNRPLKHSPYRYAFNSMEKDDEVKGEGNSYTTEFRQYDPRLGRWLTLDPLFSNFPWQSPYCSFDNNPLIFTDVKGDSTKFVNEQGETIFDVQDGSEEVFVIDKGKITDVYFQIKNNIKENKIFSAEENAKIGEKYGKNINKMSYKSYGDVGYDYYAQAGYECGYSGNECRGLEATIYSPQTEDANYRYVYNYQKGLGSSDNDKGVMHRYKPTIKNTTPEFKIVQNKNSINGISIQLKNGREIDGSSMVIDMYKQLDNSYKEYLMKPWL